MQARAVLKNQRTSAQKARLVANEIRGKSIDQALDFLNYCPRKAAGFIKKVVESAMANAEQNHGMDIEELFVHRICVDEGFTLKRFRARAKGRGTRILKRTCHVTVVLADASE